MAEFQYRNRRAVAIENGDIRVTMLVEGGHIAELTHKASGVNPMWTPPWPSIEPSKFNATDKSYGDDAEAKLLAGIMGHNVCIDVFGGPSPEEAAAGLTVHGESSVAKYDITVSGGELISKAHLPLARLDFERRIRLDGSVALITESLTNRAAHDHPTAWTQHVTLGPPFLERGKTVFRLPATRSRVFETDFGGEFGYAKIGADFDWPNVPLKRGGTLDLRTYNAAEHSAGYTAHLLDPHREQAFFAAWSPTSSVLCGYAWKRTDFPWIGIWEENHARTNAPWKGNTMTRGMEFGASPMPETRRQMIDRGSLYGVPGYRWIPAGKTVSVHYCAFVQKANKVPDEVVWEGGAKLKFS